jgi:hypothetical protein
VCLLRVIVLHTLITLNVEPVSWMQASKYPVWRGPPFSIFTNREFDKLFITDNFQSPNPKRIEQILGIVEN